VVVAVVAPVVTVVVAVASVGHQWAWLTLPTIIQYYGGKAKSGVFRLCSVMVAKTSPLRQGTRHLCYNHYITQEISLAFINDCTLIILITKKYIAFEQHKSFFCIQWKLLEESSREWAP
jgi:hypothetical protein